MGSGGRAAAVAPARGSGSAGTPVGWKGAKPALRNCRIGPKLSTELSRRFLKLPAILLSVCLQPPPSSSGGSKHFTSIIRDPPRALGTALSPAWHGDARDVPSLCHPRVHPQPFASRSGAAIPTTLPSPGAENRSRSPDSHFPLSFQARSTVRSGQPCTPCALPAGQHQPWLHKGEGSCCPRTFPSLKIFFNYREAAR